MSVFAVVGATGRTGAGCVDELLKQGHRVRAIVRSEASAEKLKAKGVEVFVGDVLDVDVLTAAFTGVDGAYVMNPTSHTQSDMLAYGRTVYTAQIAAATQARVPHVVGLSSIGAQHASGTGTIINPHVFEQLLKGSSLSYTLLRAPLFIDNWAGAIAAARSQGILPSMYQDSNVKFPQASAYDIGTIAAQALIDGPRLVKGQPRIIEVHGPEEYSVSDVANALSEVLGKPVNVAMVPVEQHVPLLQSRGLSEKSATTVAGLYASLTAGLLTFEGYEARRGSTSLVQALTILAAPAPSA